MTRAFVILMALLLAPLAKVSAEPVKLAAGQSPADNPLKGLVPYAQPQPGRFPHSLEFDYLALSDLMTGAESFDWQPLEKLLNGVAARGNQTIFRVWVEYPGHESGLPRFLREAGVRVTEWKSEEQRPVKNVNFSPDYSDERLNMALETFVAALGKRYDGDARIGYITAGLLGSWGEWHTFPRGDLFASIKTQQRVLDAYQKAFSKTPVLLRYPTGDADPTFAANAQRPFGYHDDSFAWGTLDTGRKADGWYYLARLKSAGNDALTKWKTQPIGGEVRPEVWGQIHDAQPAHKQAQDFVDCVEQTHVTWLMESGMFDKVANPARRERAIGQVRRMGYDFQVQTADITRAGQRLRVGLTVSNHGVAPFYHDWRMEMAALDREGGVAQRWGLDWKLNGLLPADAAREWTVTVDLSDPLTAGQPLVIRVINPLRNGKPLRFANADQDRHAPGWLSIGQVP